MPSGSVHAAARARLYVDAHGSPVGDELVHRFVSCSTTCIRKSDWLVRSGDLEFMIVLPETDTKGARCVARKLSEAFARPVLPATKESVGGAIKFRLSAMDPAIEGGGAAAMRALLQKAEGLQSQNSRAGKGAKDTGRVQYLSDLGSASEAKTGRDWPAT